MFINFSYPYTKTNTYFFLQKPKINIDAPTFFLCSTIYPEVCFLQYIFSKTVQLFNLMYKVCIEVFFNSRSIYDVLLGKHINNK